MNIHTLTFRKICFLALFLALHLSAPAQNSGLNWQVYQDEESYRIEQANTHCSNLGNGTVSADYIFLKLTNKTTKEITLSFQVEAYYDEKCRTCNSEFYYSFEIPAKKSIEPNCKWENGQLAIIKNYVSGLNDPSRFTKLQLTNITVK